MEVYHDLHIHTKLSMCCQDKFQTPSNIISYYENHGIKLVGFSDHIWQNPNINPNSWYASQGPVRFNSLNKEIDKINTDIKILYGCEADTIAPGKFSITKQFAETIDYVILSTNHFHFRDLVEQPEYPTPSCIAEKMIELFKAGVNSGLATIIPHCFVAFSYWEHYDRAIDLISDERFIELFSNAAQNNVAIEITTAYFPPPGNTVRMPWSIETPARVLYLAKKAGCKFTFGSDAHSLNALTLLHDLKYFIDLLELTEDDIHPVARL